MKLLVLAGVILAVIPALFWGVNNGITLTGVLLFGTGIYAHERRTQ